MPVTLRPMCQEDAVGLGAMHHQAWVDTYGPMLPDDYFETWTAADAVDRWRAILADPTVRDVVRVVAVEGDQVLGFVTAGSTRDVAGRPPRARETELWGLYVASPFLGTGLGLRLLDAGLARDDPAELWVARDNARARAFYERNRFRPDGATFTDTRFPDLLELRMVR